MRPQLRLDGSGAIGRGLRRCRGRRYRKGPCQNCLLNPRAAVDHSTVACCSCGIPPGAGLSGFKQHLLDRWDGGEEATADADAGDVARLGGAIARIPAQLEERRPASTTSIVGLSVLPQVSIAGPLWSPKRRAALPSSTEISGSFSSVTSLTPPSSCPHVTSAGRDVRVSLPVCKYCADKLARSDHGPKTCTRRWQAAARRLEDQERSVHDQDHGGDPAGP